MMEVVVLSGASSQVLGIYRWLEDAYEGRGDDFYADFLEGCSQLSRFPEIAPRYDAHFRKLLLRKWRIGIYYRISGLRIMVSAVMDLRQDPALIRRYLETL